MKLRVTPRGDGCLTYNPVWLEHVTQRENSGYIFRFRVSKNYDELKTTKTRLRSKSSHYDKSLSMKEMNGTVNRLKLKTMSEV